MTVDVGCSLNADYPKNTDRMLKIKINRQTCLSRKAAVFDALPFPPICMLLDYNYLSS